jgi:hypothetical protein
MKKRGQTTVSAVEVSVLVFLIGVFMIAYIILLPAEDREALLDEDFGASGDSDAASISETLLSESPGEVSSTKSSASVSEFEPMRLYSITDSITEDLASSLTVSRNILKNNYKNIYFNVDDLDNLEDLGLLFLITESKGELSVVLNDNLVYEGELTSNDLPVTLPTTQLLEENNLLKLYVNSPGWNIFSANYYLLQDIQLVENYEVSDTTSTRTFSVSEPGNVNSATLTYFISCNSNDDGILSLTLNSREVFSDRIFCEYLNERELGLDVDYLQTTNTLRFDITEGDYNIEEVELEISKSSSKYPSYSFDIDSDTYEDITSGEKEVYLKLSFSDDTSEKIMTVRVQENGFGVNTEDDSYEKVITSLLDNGANTITLEPDATFEIENLKVYTG